MTTLSCYSHHDTVVSLLLLLVIMHHHYRHHTDDIAAPTTNSSECNIHDVVPSELSGMGAVDGVVGITIIAKRSFAG